MLEAFLLDQMLADSAAGRVGEDFFNRGTSKQVNAFRE